MADETIDFYDRLASSFHLIFEDWEASISRQAEILGPIIECECGSDNKIRILDCACGIGTQSLGLARRGHSVLGCDLSRAAVERARAEAHKRGLALQFHVVNMLDLRSIPEGEFDAAICIDNALPHLAKNEDLHQAAIQIRSKLRPGGTLVASIRDYDCAIQEKPVLHGPAFYSDHGRRRIVHQLWDWMDERRYALHLYITRETREGWEAQHYVSTYRAVLRDELTNIVSSAGFTDLRWLMPPDSNFYQPLLVARALNS